MTQQLSEIVRVTATIAPSGTARASIGKVLHLVSYSGDALDAAGSRKVKTYNSLRSVADDFDSDSIAYRLAQRHFAQTPYPNDLLIGRWNSADDNAEIRGGAHATFADLSAISDGSFSVDSANFTGTDFSSDADLAAIAATLASKIGGGVIVRYDDAEGRFVMEFPGAADNARTRFLAPHTNGAGTDISGLLGLDVANATYHPGAGAETVQEALDAIQDLDATFFFVVLDPTFNDTQRVLDVAAWVAAQPAIFCAESNDVAVLATGEGASFAARLSMLQSDRTLLTWSRISDYKAVSIASRLSSVNFRIPGSLITAAFKQLPGCTPDVLSPSERAELERKRINYYVAVGGTNVYMEGWTLKPGVWVDVTYWIDWIRDAIKVAVFNLLTSSRRVPQTVEGIAAIREVITDVCEEGVRNGGIAPGTVSAGMAARIAAVTEVDEFNGELPNGYLIYIAPLDEQDAGERTARRAPAINVWLKGSGAVHGVDVDLTFEN